MNSSSHLGHEELLTLARKVDAAASDGDRGRLETAAVHFLDALMDHVQVERIALAELPSDDGNLIVRHQQQLVDLAVELTTVVQSPAPCRCHTLAPQLVAMLTVQANDERKSLGRLPPRPVPERSP